MQIAGSGALARLQAQLRANPRLAIGIAAIAVLIWLWLLLALSAAVERTRARVAERQQSVQRSARLAQGRDWLAEAAQAAAQRAEMNQALWPMANEGLARAEFQEWVTAAARGAGMSNVQTRIELGDPPGEKVALRRIQVTLSADLDGPSLERFLATLATTPRRISVQALRAIEQPARADLLLVAFGAPK